MLKWFRRAADAPTPPERKPARPAPAPSGSSRPAPSRAAVRAARPAEPPPLPQVVAEGSSEADWSAWEDSVAALDSRFESLGPSSRIMVRDTRPSQLDEPDPFATVRQRRDR